MREDKGMESHLPGPPPPSILLQMQYNPMIKFKIYERYPQHEFVFVDTVDDQ